MNHHASSLHERCAEFYHTHHKLLEFHAGFLHGVEHHAQARREDPLEAQEAATEGTYSRQAEYLKKMLDWIKDRAEGKPLEKNTPEARLETQTIFTHAMAAINMITEEHQQQYEYAREGTDATRLADAYREEHYIASDMPLDKQVQEEIDDLVNSNRMEMKDMQAEIHQLCDLQADIQAIREQAVGLKPRSNRREGGRG